MFNIPHHHLDFIHICLHRPEDHCHHRIQRSPLYFFPIFQQDLQVIRNMHQQHRLRKVVHHYHIHDIRRQVTRKYRHSTLVPINRQCIHRLIPTVQTKVRSPHRLVLRKRQK